MEDEHLFEPDYDDIPILSDMEIEPVEDKPTQPRDIKTQGKRSGYKTCPICVHSCVHSPPTSIPRPSNGVLDL